MPNIFDQAIVLKIVSKFQKTFKHRFNIFEQMKCLKDCLKRILNFFSFLLYLVAFKIVDEIFVFKSGLWREIDVNLERWTNFKL